MKIPKSIPKHMQELMEQMDWLFDLSHFDRSIAIKEDPDGDSIMDVTITEHYNQIHINIYPMFWTHSRESQRKSMLHEYCHTLVVRLETEAKRAIQNEFTNRERVVDALEKSVVGITERLDRLLSGRSGYAIGAYKKFAIISRPKKRSKRTPPRSGRRKTR